jgi:hypothetical protein
MLTHRAQRRGFLLGGRFILRVCRPGVLPDNAELLSVEVSGLRYFRVCRLRCDVCAMHMAMRNGRSLRRSGRNAESGERREARRHQQLTFDHGCLPGSARPGHRSHAGSPERESKTPLSHAPFRRNDNGAALPCAAPSIK